MPLHFAASNVEAARLEGWQEAASCQGETAEDLATRHGHWALAGMLLLARMAKAWWDVWGQTKPHVLAEVEALVAARVAAAAMAGHNSILG